ncbi:MAG TPA: S4 domain-containing protein, partial [Steroidobacteraceae bacterium]|nr:S4 domain-containing protein [Steroidobacteraceae bacterium]
MARAPARTGGGRRRVPGSRDSAGARPRAPLGAGTHAERLQKMLARAGLASRREAEAWIRAGRLTINGRPAELGARVAPQDQVRLDGRLVRARAADAGARAFLCHRSPGEPLRTQALPAADPGGQAPRAALLERLPRRSGRRFIAVSP